MKRTLICAAFGATLAMPALAQDYGGSTPAKDAEILDLSVGADGSGTAIIADGLGEKYACSTTEKRTHMEIGGCKPIRLSERVGGYIEAQGKVLRLFERNKCNLSYDQLKSALASADEATRKSVGEIMADMTNSGALVDDEARASAKLTVGSVCGK